MDSSFFFTIVAAAIGLLMLLKKLRFHQEDKKENSSSPSPPSSLSPSSVPPSSLCRTWTHHVFPSFRGEDVRRDFLSHIQVELQRKGITPFIDNDIKRGESIGPELIRAIRGSKIAIVLLSKNYASSSWCLDELAEIMKCKEELGQTVMVVFYKVDPSNVKKLNGDFGKVFKKTCAGKRKEDIGRWIQALEKVATIAGYHSSNWDNEAAMIRKIAGDISNMLNNSAPSSDFDGLVGMRAHLEKMGPLLCLDSDEVRMIGIWGPSGIGKTTIARVAYNELSYRFQLSVFMENIKETNTRPCSDDYSAKLRLQQQLMSQITNQKDIEIPHLGVVRDRLKDKKVLVVLDGVDQSMQLDAMAKETCWFGPGSRIIITTQYQTLFRAHGINNIYKVDFPEPDEALQILCMYAFGQKFPKDGFEELAWEVTRLAGNLPLGLRVMGSYFRRMSKQEWINALPKLRTSINKEIGTILKFCYDVLDDEDKDLFLHLACFFNYQGTNNVENHLAKRLLDVKQGLNDLAEKSLISIDEGYITIHNLLAQLGREIVRKQSVHKPGKRQFLVDEREICDLLIDDATGSRSVIGIKFHFDIVNDKLNISERAFEGMSNLQFIKFYGDHDKLHLPRGLDYLPPKLQLLHWHHFSMTCLPSTVNTEFLVEVNLRRSNLEKLWEGIKPLHNLKWMDLSSSVNLKELPDLSTATNLQELNLSHCSSLISLPSSIRNATNLEKLYLGGCSSLVELPIGKFINLKELDLSYCSSLVELPSTIGYTNNLQELNLRDCLSLVTLPSSIENATNIEKLYLDGCSSLVEFPIGKFINLKELDLSHCTCLVKLPSTVGNATNLEKLDLSYCSNLVELPFSIGNLQKLQTLRLHGCSKLEVLPTNINLEFLDELDLTDCSTLKSLPEISTNIKVLRLRGTAIEEVPLSIRSWSRLDEFYMSYTENLKKFPHAFDIITTLDLSYTEIKEIPSWIESMSHLVQLQVNGCRKLVSLPQIPASTSFIDAEDCESLERLDCSFHNPEITLKFVKCFKLNQEARDLIIQTGTSNRAVLPGGEVPAYFTHRATTGGSLTINLEEKPLPTSMRFKACVLLNKVDDEAGDDMFPMLGIDGLGLTCKKSEHHLYPLLTEHLYLFEVEAEVSSSKPVLKFKVNDKGWKIGECGVFQLLEEVP